MGLTPFTATSQTAFVLYCKKQPLIASTAVIFLRQQGQNPHLEWRSDRRWEHSRLHALTTSDFCIIQESHIAVKNVLACRAKHGGIFAASLGSQLGFPLVAINPAMNPAESLRKHIGAFQAYSGAQCVLKEESVEAYGSLPFRMDKNGFVVIDMGNKIIDAQQTLRVVGNNLPVVAFPDR